MLNNFGIFYNLPKDSSLNNSTPKVPKKKKTKKVKILTVRILGAIKASVSNTSLNVFLILNSVRSFTDLAAITKVCFFITFTFRITSMIGPAHAMTKSKMFQ